MLSACPVNLDFIFLVQFTTLFIAAIAGRIFFLLLAFYYLCAIGFDYVCQPGLRLSPNSCLRKTVQTPAPSEKPLHFVFVRLASSQAAFGLEGEVRWGEAWELGEPFLVHRLH
jgi:hypothetical protein